MLDIAVDYVIYCNAKLEASGQGIVANSSRIHFGAVLTERSHFVEGKLIAVEIS